MLIRTNGATLSGIDGVLVSVEVDAGRGLPAFHIVGQGDRVVSESRDRIRAAFRQSGLEFPPGRVTVNLAPSEVPKAGSSLDLPIALGIAATRVSVPVERLAGTLLVGELGLDGALHPVRGTLALVAAARAAGVSHAIAPSPSLEEARICPGIQVSGAPDLASVVGFLSRGTPLPPPPPGAEAGSRSLEPDLVDVRGQEIAKRALEVAAAGRHNLLLVGPPGSGKTLLARRLPGLLPDLPFEHALEATRIHGVAGTLGGRALLARPPFRAPHHTCSEAGMTGGGRPLRPGEMSLAHRGILFLDELPEFRRPVLEALRQPLEEGVVRVVRAHGVAQLPTRFQLVAAMNPCPCGYRDDPGRECSCDETLVRRYRSKLSGPLLDRIGLRVPVPTVPWRTLVSETSAAETTGKVRERVLRARALQHDRYRSTPASSNADLAGEALRRHCALSPEARRLLDRSGPKLALSVRGYERVMRLARTIADLEQDDRIQPAHLAEALGYRALE